jgi:hypothetical protein
MYKKFSGYIIIFPKIQLFSKFTFSCPENYLNSPENLLQIYLNLPKSALEIYLKFLMSNYQGCCTPPTPPVGFKQTLSDLLFMYFTSQNIVHHTLEHFAYMVLLIYGTFSPRGELVPSHGASRRRLVRRLEIRL